MESEDVVRVEIGGREYAVIAGRLEAIERDNKEIHAAIVAMDKKLDMLLVRVNAVNERIDDLKFYVSTSFTVLALFVGLFAVVPIAGKIWEKLTKSTMTEERISVMIKEGISQALASK